MSPHRVERVLHVHLSTPEEPQASLCNALASLTTRGGYCRIDWPSIATLRQRQEAVVSAAATHKPTLVFMQLQCPGVLSADSISQIRRAAGVNDLLIATWCGDVGGYNGPYRCANDRWVYELASRCDLVLYTSMSQVRAMRSRGVHNAAYLQIGYDEERYYEGPQAEYGNRFDAVFLGTRFDERQWSSLLPENDVALRATAVATLRRELGSRFGLFGANWSGAARLPPAVSGDVYRGAHLGLVISLCSNLERYSSDRLLRALGCGTAVLLKRFADWSSFGLQEEQNVLTWDSLAELTDRVRKWTAGERAARTREIGRAGAQLARTHHSWGIRMLELYPLIAAVRGDNLRVARPW